MLRKNNVSWLPRMKEWLRDEACLPVQRCN
jgi:hypothetical protein